MNDVVPCSLPDAPVALRDTPRSAPGGEPSRMADREGRGLVVVLALVVLAGLLIRGHHLAARSLWFDEAFTWRLITFPLPELLERAARDNSPPLYFLLLHAWTAIAGTSALALRLPSMLCGGLTIVGMYLFATEALAGQARTTQGRAAVRSWEAGLLVAALVAASPFQVRWAWEVRPYTLGTALAAFSSWALCRALRTPERLGPWVLYGVLALLFAYTHYFALFTLAAQALFLAGYVLVRAGWRSRLGGNVALAGALVAVGWLPWLPTFLRQRAQVQADFWIPPLTWFDVPKLAYEMFIHPQDARLTTATVLGTGILGTLGLLVLVWWVRAGGWRAWTPGEAYIAVAAVVPFALAALVSWQGTSVFHLRYFLFAHLFLLAAFGGLLRWAPSRTVAGGCAAMALASFLALTVDMWRKLDIGNRPGARAAAAWIAGRRQPGEPVLIRSPRLYLPLLYHAADRTEHYVYGDWHAVRHYDGASVLGPEEFVGPREMEAFRAPRLWAVTSRGGSWHQPDIPVPACWRPTAWQQFPEVYRFQGTVTVVEYERAEP